MSRKRLFDDEDRYSVQSPPIVALVNAALVPLVKEVDGAGYSLRDLELLVVREMGTLISETILRRQLTESKARQPIRKFSERVDDLKENLGLTKHKGRGK